MANLSLWFWQTDLGTNTKYDSNCHRFRCHPVHLKSRQKSAVLFWWIMKKKLNENKDWKPAVRIELKVVCCILYLPFPSYHHRFLHVWTRVFFENIFFHNYFQGGGKRGGEDFPRILRFSERTDPPFLWYWKQAGSSALFLSVEQSRPKTFFDWFLEIRLNDPRD